MYAVLSCAANIENFTRQKKKGRRKAPSGRMLRGKGHRRKIKTINKQIAQNDAAIKRAEKILRRYKMAHGNKGPRADHTAHEENKFYASKVKCSRGKTDPW